MHPSLLLLGRLQTPRRDCDWPAQMADRLRHPSILGKEKRRRDIDQNNTRRLPREDAAAATATERPSSLPACWPSHLAAQ